MERPGDTAIQGIISVAEDDPNRALELPQSWGSFSVCDLTMGKVFIQAKEGGAGAGCGVELLIQQRHELTSDIRVSDEPPDLPPVHPAEEPVPEDLRHRPRDASDHGRGEEPDRLRRPERRHFAVVRVQQHQPFHALGVGQCPVDSRRARGVVRDEDDRPELQLCDRRRRGRRLDCPWCRSSRAVYPNCPTRENQMPRPGAAAKGRGADDRRGASCPGTRASQRSSVPPRGGLERRSGVGPAAQKSLGRPSFALEGKSPNGRACSGPQ